MENEFINFANVWVYLAFEQKFEQLSNRSKMPNTLKKKFGMHTLQVIMDHDRPVPDTYSVLFDIKKTFQPSSYVQMNDYGIEYNSIDQAHLLAQLNYSQGFVEISIFSNYSYVTN